MLPPSIWPGPRVRGSDLGGDRPHEERRAAEQQQRHRLVGHVEPDRPQADRHEAADDAGRRGLPHDVLAPQERPPAVGGHLGDGMQHHGLRQRHDDQQHADQDQAARHAEDARQQRGEDHEQGQAGGKQGSHGGASGWGAGTMGDRCAHFKYMINCLPISSEYERTNWWFIWCKFTEDLILRSRAQAASRRMGAQRRCSPPFETALRASSRVRVSAYRRPTD